MGNKKEKIIELINRIKDEKLLIYILDVIEYLILTYSTEKH